MALRRTYSWNKRLWTLGLLLGVGISTGSAQAQNIYTWNGGTGAAWLTTGNWTGGPAGTYPGFYTGGANNGAVTDIAAFTGANTATNVGINMNTAGGLFTLAAIDFNRTGTAAFQIGNSSSTVNGVLQLNGVVNNAQFGTDQPIFIRNAGSGNLTIANVNSGTGTQTMGLRLGRNDAVGQIVAATGRVLTISSIISGVDPASGFTKTGGGALALTAANTFQGGVNLNEGWINFNNPAAFGTGTINVAAGVVSQTGFAGSPGQAFLNNNVNTNQTLANNIVLPAPAAQTTYTLQKTAAGGQLNMTGAITGGNANVKLFLQTSAGGDNTTTYRFGGANTFVAGQIELWRGGIVLATPTSLGDAANVLRLNPNNNTALGDLRFETAGTFPNAIEFLSATAINPGAGNTVTLSGNLTGTAAWQVIGSGAGTIALTGATNTNSGNITVQTGGTLRIGAGGSNGSAGTANIVNNGTLNIQRVDNWTMANVISGPGTVNMIGTGVTTLSAANTFTGPLNINNGTLALDAAATLATNAINVNANPTNAGIFDVSAIPGYIIPVGRTLTAGRPTTPANDILGAVEIQGTFNVGGNSLFRSATFGNNLTLTGANLNYDLANVTTVGGGINDWVNVNGDLTLNGTNNFVVNAAAGLGNGTYTLMNYSGTLTGTAANLSLGGIAAGTTRQAFAFDLGTVGQIRLNVTGNPASLSWTGANGNVWDLVTTNNNFTGDPDNRFYNFDNVSFTGGTSTVTLTGSLNPGSVTVNSAQNYTFSGTGSISGTTSLIKSGTGTLILETNNTYTGGTTINAGTVQIGTGGTTGGITGNVVNNGALIISRSDAFAFPGVISGTGPLTFNGTGTLSLFGSNSFTGATTITGGGTVSIAADTNLGTAPGAATPGQIVINNGTLSATAGFILNGNRGLQLANAVTINVAAGTLNYPGILTGTGTLAKTGTGTLILSGQNTYNGPIAVNAGTIVPVLTSVTTTPLGTGAVTITAGATMNFWVADATVQTFANPITLPATGQQVFIIRAADGSAPGTLGTGVRLTGVISGGGAGQTFRFTDTNAGGNHNNVTILDNPNNTLAGILEMWRGTLAITSNEALGNVTRIRHFTESANGSFRFDADNITLPAGREFQFVSTNVQPINTQGFTATIAGPFLAGTAGALMAKQGTGTLILTGTSTEQVNLRLDAGALRVNGQTGNGTVTVGITSRLEGSGTIGGAVTVQTGGSIRAGDPLSVTANTITLNAGVVVSDGGIIQTRIHDGSTPSATAGGSTLGTLPNPTSNNFWNITAGTTTVGPNALIQVDTTGATFTLNQAYSYRLAQGAGDQSTLNIVDPALFTFTGVVGLNPSLTGDATGNIFLNFTPVPEPVSILLGGIGGVWLMSQRRRKTVSSKV